MTPPDEIVALIHSHYASLNFKPPPNQSTILAGFALSNANGATKVISLGSGSKCLPASKLGHGGDLVHDSHAEVLARRGAVRFLMEEVHRAADTNRGSRWLEWSEGKYRLRDGVKVHLYVSTPPCKLTNPVNEEYILIFGLALVLASTMKVVMLQLDTLPLSKIKPWPRLKTVQYL